MKKVVNSILIVCSVMVPIHANSQTIKVVNEMELENVADILAVLKAKSTVAFTTTKPDGWLIATEESPFSIWSFTPETHYAYPAVVKRQVIEDIKGDISIRMTALCQAQKKACDQLMLDFKSMNKMKP